MNSAVVTTQIQTNQEGPRVLNLGGGGDRSISDAVTIDINPLTSPDIVHDLNETPWPLEDNTFDATYCKDIIQHLDDLLETMEEIHRIAKSRTVVSVTTPHFSCSNSYTDPTHRHHLGMFSFDFFADENKVDYYTHMHSPTKKRKLFFNPGAKNTLMRRIAIPPSTKGI